ncbi:hypothetical protein E2C01_085966 [Portunus trituberculatus]|uniref:Uncharacterized protein n=1 Tax=Portunus trituberculatus TaxID=210409 RepID=A0A5B7JDC3_PORTR|nr:hypothetical protein [Portunus trituberculatus]
MACFRRWCSRKLTNPCQATRDGRAVVAGDGGNGKAVNHCLACIEVTCSGRRVEKLKQAILWSSGGTGCSGQA